VDVVNTPQSNNRPRRRKRDGLDDWNRALEWSVRPDDIDIHPHSPLAIADILTRDDGCLDLVPDTIERPLVKSHDKVTTLRHDTPAKQCRSKANLLTRHSVEELFSRCKAIQVANALVKQPGTQRLYVAAGFLKWRLNGTERQVRAPLLLFPAILALKPHAEETPERRYELRFKGTRPDINLELVDVARDRWNLQLPDYDKRKAITESLNLQQLNSVMNLIGQPDKANYDWKANQAANDGVSHIAEIHQLARRLADVGLERVEFRHLDDLPERLHKWTLSVREMLKNPTINTILATNSLTALQLIRLSSMVELIDGEAKEFNQYRHPHLAFQTTRALLRRAKHQAKLIEQELGDLQQYFYLDQIPSKKQLLNLIDELGGNDFSEPDVVDADYFHARRQFMEFSVDKPASLTTEHRRQLSQLAKVLRFRELFVTNSEYRQALGPGYRGLQTQWDELESMIRYASELAEHLESETLAAQLLEHWPQCRSLYVNGYEQLQTAADSLRKMLRVVGASHRHTALEKLVTTTTVLADNLQSWRAPELDLDAHSYSTAADVLTYFSGLARTDLRTEEVVTETELRIRNHVKRRQTEPKAVIETLTWLLQASETATQQALDIDAIVSRLHIA